MSPRTERPGPPPPEGGPHTPESLDLALKALGIEPVRHAHAALHTVAESRALRGEIPGVHCKNLFLKDKKGALWLFVTVEERALDLKALKRAMGAAHLSFGSPELLREVLGVEPGSVTPFAAINDPGGRVAVVLDRAMLGAGPLNYHPLVNTETWTLSADDLLRFLRWTGHEPKIVDVEG